MNDVNKRLETLAAHYEERLHISWNRHVARNPGLDPRQWVMVVLDLDDGFAMSLARSIGVGEEAAKCVRNNPPDHAPILSCGTNRDLVTAFVETVYGTQAAAAVRTTPDDSFPVVVLAFGSVLVGHSESGRMFHAQA